VSSTSPKRRSTIHNKSAIETSATAAATWNDQMIVSAHSKVEIAWPVALG
jgi:hypothetical protein